MSSFRTRLRQGLTALFRPQPPQAIPEQWAGALPDAVPRAWLQLAAYDQRHLVAVAEDLERAGACEPVVLAGLLHDIGKHGGVPLPARVAAVLLKRLAPSLADHIRRRTSPPIGLKGLHLVLTHAERGADMLEASGVNARIVWLVRHHETNLTDSWLATLRHADNLH